MTAEFPSHFVAAQLRLKRSNHVEHLELLRGVGTWSADIAVGALKGEIVWIERMIDSVIKPQWKFPQSEEKVVSSAKAALDAFNSYLKSAEMRGYEDPATRSYYNIAVHKLIEAESQRSNYELKQSRKMIGLPEITEDTSFELAKRLKRRRDPPGNFSEYVLDWEITS